MTPTEEARARAAAMAEALRLLDQFEDVKWCGSYAVRDQARLVRAALAVAGSVDGAAGERCPNPMAHDRPHHTEMHHNDASGGWTAACIDCRWDSGHSLHRAVVERRAIEHQEETDPLSAAPAVVVGAAGERDRIQALCPAHCRHDADDLDRCTEHGLMIHRARGCECPSVPADLRRTCPRCGSPDPARHPAVQFEGECQVCPHPFHASTENGRQALDRRH